LESGDLDTLPNSAFQTASMIHSVLLADVRRDNDEGGSYRLKRIGIGLCMPDRKGRDMVVSTEQSGRLDVAIGTLASIVLEAAEAELAQSRLVTASSTFALYRAPTRMLVGETHRVVDLVYALSVDENTGKLETYIWKTDPKQPNGFSPSRVVQLRPNYFFACPIHVQARRLLGSIPVSWSFALQSLPSGESRTIEASMGDLLRNASVDSDPNQLEHALSRLFDPSPNSTTTFDQAASLSETSY
jgi:hypothetical protein